MPAPAETTGRPRSGGLPPAGLQPPGFAVGAVLALRRGLQRLADKVLPAPVAVFDRSLGIASTMVLGVVAELGVADLLVDEPRSAAELAELIDGPVDVDALHRVLRAAAVFDLVQLRGDGRFAATSLTRVMDSRHPNSTADWCRYFASGSNVAAWADMLGTVRSGENAFGRVHGSSVWDYFNAHPEEGRTFAAAMRHITELEAPSIATAYPFPATGTVCDVAGGSATLLARVLDSHPDAGGILVEAPLVLEEAALYLDRVGLRDRVQFVEGDIFSGFEAEADVYLLKDILHDWGDDACRRILAATAAAMPDASRLVLVENALEANEVHPILALTDVHMMLGCEQGRQRSIAELQGLLRDAGLEPGTVTTMATGLSLVEGVAPPR